MEAQVAAEDASPRDWVWAVTYSPAIVFRIVVQLLSFALAVLHFLASPLLYLGHGIAHLALLPLRILAKFEVSVRATTMKYCMDRATHALARHFSCSWLAPRSQEPRWACSYTSPEAPCRSYCA